jgi:hypothetical protein
VPSTTSGPVDPLQSRPFRSLARFKSPHRRFHYYVVADPAVQEPGQRLNSEGSVDRAGGVGYSLAIGILGFFWVLSLIIAANTDVPDFYWPLAWSVVTQPACPGAGQEADEVQRLADSPHHDPRA